MNIESTIRYLKRSFFNSLPETIWSEYIVAYTNYFINHGKFPNLKKPKTFNEKTLWRRFHDRDIDFPKYVDKIEVRKHIENTIGRKYLVPLIGQYSNIEEINISKLPNRFVLKTTHGSGGNILCLNKNDFNWEKAKHKLQKSLKTNYYLLSREIVYKDIEPRIICEELLEDNIIDYKFFCYEGEPLYIEIDANRYTGHLRSFYRINWEEIKGAKMTYPNIPPEMLNKPAHYEEMLDICRTLASEFKFVRVDLYYTAQKIYFGELTFFHTAGVEKIEPEEFAIELGEPLKIDKYISRQKAKG
jgi:hypothetical protein